jgi:hypothetical protein
VRVGGVAIERARYILLESLYCYTSVANQKYPRQQGTLMRQQLSLPQLRSSRRASTTPTATPEHDTSHPHQHKLYRHLHPQGRRSQSSTWQSNQSQAYAGLQLALPDCPQLISVADAPTGSRPRSLSRRRSVTSTLTHHRLYPLA